AIRWLPSVPLASIPRFRKISTSRSPGSISKATSMFLSCPSLLAIGTQIAMHTLSCAVCSGGGHDSSPRRHLKKNSRSPVPAPPSGVQLWAGKIFSVWQRTVESYIEVGQLLIEARQNLAHGDYEATIRTDLPFSAATARKLVAIADHEVLSNRSHGNGLPS